jgi:phosphoribosylformylglycinamidine cyclo-ligase
MEAGPTHPTLAAAGVSRGAAVRLLGRISPGLRSTDPEGRVLDLPGFCAAVDAGEGLVLAATADGVGTKRALMGGRLADLGRDLVAYNVNDLATIGVRPMVFLDYLSVGRLVVEDAADLVDGMAAACREAGCVLLGGETAEHPGIQGIQELDLAGFAAGLVARDSLVDGSRCRAGDVVVGIGSSGPHASGFSLIRHAFARVGKPVPDTFLAPTPVLNRVVEDVREVAPVTALAHICDGGLTENVVRGMPESFGVVLRAAAWPRPAWVEDLLRIGCGIEELRGSVNVGIAFAIATSPGAQGAVLRTVSAAGLDAWQIGEVVDRVDEDRVTYEE